MKELKVVNEGKGPKKQARQKASTSVEEHNDGSTQLAMELNSDETMIGKKRLLPECEYDFYVLEKYIIEKGDEVNAKAFRKVSVSSGGDEDIKKKANKNILVQGFATVIVDKVTYDNQCMRISGPIRSCTNDVAPLGSFHTFNVGINEAPFQLYKVNWTQDQLEKLRECCDSVKKTDLALVVLRTNGASILLLQNLKPQISKSVVFAQVRKNRRNADTIIDNQQRFYNNVGTTLEDMIKEAGGISADITDVKAKADVKAEAHDNPGTQKEVGGNIRTIVLAGTQTMINDFRSFLKTSDLAKVKTTALYRILNSSQSVIDFVTNETVNDNIIKQISKEARVTDQISVSKCEVELAELEAAEKEISVTLGQDSACVYGFDRCAIALFSIPQLITKLIISTSYLSFENRERRDMVEEFLDICKQNNIAVYKVDPNFTPTQSIRTYGMIVLFNHRLNFTMYEESFDVEKLKKIYDVIGKTMTEEESDIDDFADF